MTLVWIGVLIVGLGAAMWASSRAVGHASALAFGLRIPPFLIGITLVGIGTDLPEIANSIVASITQNGDLNVGDSTGSAATQITLVLGLAPFLGGAFLAGRSRVLLVGSLTAAGLGIGAVLFADGYLSRGDAFILLGAWLVFSITIWRNAPPGSEPSLAVPSRNKAYHLWATLLFLAIVGGGAYAAVHAFVNIAEELGVSQYVISFFVGSIGTSLPEMIVAVSALRQGERDIAIGDLFGASLSDATLSIAAGPLIAPTAITAALAVRGSVTAMIVVAAVTLLLSVTSRVDWKIGVALLGLYGSFYLILL